MMNDPIDAIITTEIAAQGPGAAVAIVKDGSLLYSKGFGLANIEWGMPIAPDTVFALASITKPFTATAILLLEAQGKLHLDDLITVYVTDYPTHGYDITIKHLLTHTSGIKSYMSLEEFGAYWSKRDFSHEELIALSKDLPLEFEPGTQFKYTNYSYILLGQIIEAVSGMSYEAFVQSQIFQPLGMKHSYIMSNESIIPHRASGYVRAQEGYQHAEYLNMQIEYAAGELGSTVEDLARWDTALREYRLLDQATQERMYTPAQLLNGQRTDYGFGWGIVDYYGHRVAEHLGVFDGFSAFIARFLDDATTIIILSNLADLDAEKLTRRISSLVLDIPPLTRIPITVDGALLDKASGTYNFYGGHLEIVRDGDKLMFRGPLISQLLPINESTFYALVDEEVEVRFENDEGQSFQRFTFRTPLYSFKAKRVPQVSN
jgi:CubicO group peptidase (beta-lactamase class C family)